MKQRSLLAAAIASALVLTGCNEKGTSSASPDAAAKPVVKPEDVVATVNGTPISKEAVAMLTAQQQRSSPTAASEDKVIDELISRELMRQEAEKQKLATQPEYAARLDSTMRFLMSQIAAEHFLKGINITDEDAKKEYDNRVSALKMTEFRARHILVDKEDAAKDILAKLQKGAKFEDLAKKLSKDPGSKDHGGELGWFSPQQMVKPFADAVASLKDGEIAQVPIQTQFGWHVIQREESREQQPPAFDQVKDQIKTMLQTQKLQQHVAELKAAAKIERVEKKKEEKKEDKKEEKKGGEPAPATTTQQPETPAPAEQAAKPKSEATPAGATPKAPAASPSPQTAHPPAEKPAAEQPAQKK